MACTFRIWYDLIHLFSVRSFDIFAWIVVLIWEASGSMKENGNYRRTGWGYQTHSGILWGEDLVWFDVGMETGHGWTIIMH